MAPKKPVLKVDDLQKTFRVGFLRQRVRAVRGVSFQVEEGEIFGLLGPNGAGKTTVIKSMMGLIFPTSGEISILGHSAKKKAARKELGYLPENPYFHEYLTAAELLDFAGRLAGLSAREIRQRRDQLIEQVGLTEAASRPLRKFSKGMLQRVGLAQAIIHRPRFLVLDEPMSGLDPIGRKLVSDLIGDLNREGTTIMFSSHILSDVERLCHRVVILNKGIKVAEGRLTDLLSKKTGTETLEELFVRKAIEIN